MPGMELGVDVGTSQIVICANGRDVALREPTIMAVDSRDGHLIACGRDAYTMHGREPQTIRVVRPLRKGVIADFDEASAMIDYFIRRVCAYKLIKPRAAVSVPACITEVERRSMREAVSSANTREIKLIGSTLAAALGAGLDISRPQGCMVVDIGAGTTDAAVLSLQGISQELSVPIGGDDMDEAIIRYMRDRYSHVIGPLTAENIKIRLGCAMPPAEERTMQVAGRSALTGLPCVQSVTSTEINEVLQEVLQQIASAIQSVLERTPPELAGDILGENIILTGGCSLMDGMTEYLSRYLSTPCAVAENPRDCVAIGTAKALRYSRNNYRVEYFDA